MNNHTIIPATPADLRELAAVWEASVRATHHFLQEEDFQFYKSQIGTYLKECPLYLIRIGQENFSGLPAGSAAAFIGLQGSMIEMLFVHPACRRQGLGARLAEYALRQCGCNRVDVNEQNEQAVRFYNKLGFRTVSRDDFDGCGKPYPILHLKYGGQ